MLGNSITCKTQANHKGLSLIELISLIGVASIALMQASSALSDVRSKSRSLSCQDKLGQIARASLVYASQDRHENAIPICIRDALSTYARFSYYGYGGKGGAIHFDTTSISRDWDGRNLMGTMHRPLNGILYKKPFPTPAPISSGGGPGTINWAEDNRRDLDIYHCPEDNGFPGMHHLMWKQYGLSSYDYYGTSYSANTIHIYDPFEPGNLFTNSIYLRALSNVPDPDRTILYMENAGRFAIFSDDPELPNQANDDCRPVYREEDGYIANGWHGQPWHFNTTFGDGHVANVRIRSYANQAGNIPNAPHCGQNNVRCSCIIIRGDGWQMDALPAPSVRTSKFHYGYERIETDDDGSGKYTIVP